MEKSLGREDLLTSALGGTLTMRIEYDNCRENEGPVPGGDRLEFELNAFGKPPLLKSTDLKRVKINNTKYDSMVTFKLCIGGSPNGGDRRNQFSSEAVVVGEAKFHLAEVQTMANEQLNFFLPFKILDQSSQPNDIAMMFATRNFTFHKDGLYLLASVCITDKTFGELTINLDKIESIPRSMELREIQYRIRLVNYNWMVLAENGANPSGIKEGVLFNQVSGRIERDDYQAALDYEIDEEMNLHIQIKDLFNGGDGDDYLNPRVISMNSDVDLYLIIELVGYGENN